MSQDKTMPIMLFVLSLFLIGIGIVLSTMSQTVTRYRNVLGFQVPYQSIEQPYVGIGALMALIGIALLIASLVMIARKRERNVSMTVEIPKTQ